MPVVVGDEPMAAGFLFGRFLLFYSRFVQRSTF